MHPISYFQGAVLGLLQGVSELFPISSLGHSVILPNLLGWNIRSWFNELWDTMSEISLGYLVAGVALKTVQTTLTAFSWYAILRYAYPATRFKLVLACYAASVALNGILPANLGTFALLLMFTTIIAGATFSGVLGAYVVQKIFFTVIGAFTYLYLLLSVSGSFHALASTTARGKSRV